MSNEQQMKIKNLRESLRPNNFDAWVCLGGDFRDMAEVQEWATHKEKEQLMYEYTRFTEWLKINS